VETLTDLYVLNPAGQLIGVVSLRDVVVAAPERRIDELMNTELVTVAPDTDREEVARLVSHYDYLAMPVVTEAKKAARALRWAVGEMEKRYKLLAQVGARNINTYNERVASGKLPPAEGEDKPPRRLGYVVVVVDEFADLMVQVPAEVEEPIARLAQMARAVGIHLVLATQRPSVDVITGMIKANVPSRIAFAVSSQTDSRVILDQNGAESLLGQGDMLFKPLGTSRLQRVQGAFVTEEEIALVVEACKVQREPEIDETFLELPQVFAEDGDSEDEVPETIFHKAGMPEKIDGSAPGSTTLRSTCQRVNRNARATSTYSRPMPRIP